MDKCQACDGFGFLIPFPHKNVDVIVCDVCDGEGEIKEWHKVWEEQGKYLKSYRHQVLGMGLREASREFDIDPSNLSKMERGIIKPQPPKELYK